MTEKCMAKYALAVSRKSKTTSPDEKRAYQFLEEVESRMVDVWARISKLEDDLAHIEILVSEAKSALR